MRSRKIVKKRGERRHPWCTLFVFLNQSLIAMLSRTALLALLYSCWTILTRLVLILCFLMVAYSAACHTWSKVLFKCWLKQMGKLLLMLQVSLTDNPQVEKMLCGCCPALKSTWNFPQFSFVLLSAFLDVLIDLSIHIRFV